MIEHNQIVAALWQHSDAVIKTIAVILLIMSIASWCIMLLGAWRQLRWRSNARHTLANWQNYSVTESNNTAHTVRHINPFHALILDGHSALNYHINSGREFQEQLRLSEWLTTSLRSSIDESAQYMQRGLSILASVGATAPFVGLLGTVWSIYQALIDIGQAGQVSIDQISIPVGEALVMTAFGLAVAIPAVLAYNALVRSNKDLLASLNRFAHRLYAHLLSKTLSIKLDNGVGGQ